jgi:trehalose synthase
MDQYVPKNMGSHRGAVNIIPPAIDPLSPKNMAFSREDAAFICQQFGIDPGRPLVTQVSRFDPWKDPIGVIDAYRQITEQIPDAQLAMVGSMATDDPEGREYFQKTYEYADNDPDIKILSNLNKVRRLPAEVDPRGVRADGHRGALEGAADDRRQRRWDPAADRGRRLRLPRQLARGVRAAQPRDPPRPGARQDARPRRQGTRAPRVPLAAAAPRLARPAEPARHLT